MTVVRLKDGADVTPEPELNNAAIEQVTKVLADLVSGKVVAVAFVTVQADGKSVGTGWVCSPGGFNYHTLNSGCARLASRIAADPADVVYPGYPDESA